MGFKRTVGFTCGSFDLIHPGHIVMFEDAKHQCGYLIVGLQTDPTIDRPDIKNDPVQSVQWLEKNFPELKTKERLSKLNKLQYFAK